MAPLAVFLLTLFILPLQHQCTDDDPLDAAEKQALIDFIQKVPHSLGLIWDPSVHACDWKGAACDDSNKTVLYLKLPAKSFVGKIPPATLGKLTSLRVLSLRVNGFFGEIPSDFSNLTSLTRLSLNNNSFSGQLPYIDAPRLTRFDVSFNKLNTSIPYSFSKFAISSFSPNVFLCGPPTNTICPPEYPNPYTIKHEEHPKQSSKIVGISIGSALMVLLLLCCVWKKMLHQQQAQHLKKGEGNKLVMVANGGINSLDVEDLLKASAEVLGEGSTVGTSYKQVLPEKNMTVVVKRLRDVVVTENEFRTKMKQLEKMKHKNLVPLVAYYYSKEEKWLVYDYMPAGSLYARLHASGGTQLDWDRRMRIALSAARGLAYLHEDIKNEDKESVVHGNINSSNILLRQESNNEAFVSDYGLNMLFDASSSQDHHAMSYWAPEVHNTREVTLKSDVYSFGVLLLELLTGKNPMQASLGKEGVRFSKLLESIASEEPKDEIFDVELRMDVEEMRQLLKIAKDCVSSVPDQRPTMQDVMSQMEDMWLRHSSHDHSKGYDYTPSTETHDTPSTITQDTPSTITP